MEVDDGAWGVGIFWRSSAALVIVLVELVKDWSCELIVESILSSGWKLLVAVMDMRSLISSSFWVTDIRSVIELDKLSVFLVCSDIVGLMKSHFHSNSLINGWLVVSNLLISAFESLSDIVMDALFRMRNPTALMMEAVRLWILPS